jgi:alkanesulfonate monooxygenase SsuD/methylene tetrahydromethanopterin reductase-like flavin-dependent oxidoreductase (luciferase family)
MVTEDETTGVGTMANMIRIGVNLNNREPLLVPSYTMSDLLALAETAEDLGYDSVWVGDSLFSKPRYDPMALLAALSQRTSRVLLGTACLVAAARDPLYLALGWTTLDVMSGGRMVMGACAGNAEEGVRREFEALGLDYRTRTSRLEETLEVLRTLWTDGSVTFHGQHLSYEDVAFAAGTEVNPFRPIQTPPPIWVVSNPRIAKQTDGPEARKRVERAARRIVRLGDGWMTCCRARHPEELAEQLSLVRAAAEEDSRDLTGFEVAYQVTMHIGDSASAARSAFEDYIAAYYPEFGPKVDLGDWGPAGPPEDIAAWIEQFAEAGVTHFICRFAAVEQATQVRRLAEEVLPAFAGQRFRCRHEASPGHLST